MTRFEVGILTGSGPEAGIDLWEAVLAERRRSLGDSYRGDIDAPSVLLRSDPRLGLSMDLAAHGETVAAVSIEHAAVLDDECAAWAIACNTINRYVGEIRAAGHGQMLVSFVEVVEQWMATLPSASVALLGAAPVTALGPDSAYRALADRFVPLPAGLGEELHELIADVKRVGPPFDGLRGRFARLVDSVEADRVLLACTELPLVADEDDARLVDVTKLVAAALLDRVG